MPVSREYIDKGNKDPFIYNTVIQTAGRGKGSRKQVGSIEGNIYASSCIPLSRIKNELNENGIIVSHFKIKSSIYFKPLDCFPCF